MCNWEWEGFLLAGYAGSFTKVGTVTHCQFWFLRDVTACYVSHLSICSSCGITVQKNTAVFEIQMFDAISIFMHPFALLSLQLQKDEEFKQYLAAHTGKGRFWDNDDGGNYSSEAAVGETDGDKEKDREGEEESGMGSDGETVKKGWWECIHFFSFCVPP